MSPDRIEKYPSGAILAEFEAAFHGILLLEGNDYFCI
jgi:hypothetical protein